MKQQTPPEQWTKLDKIRFLLDQWELIFDPDTVSPFGAPGDGSGVPLLPLMSRHPSVVELARVLRLLLTAAPGDYRHLVAYRCGAEYRIRWVPTMVMGPQRRLIPGDPKPERQRIRPHWISQERVERAERFLADKFRGEVFVPDELWHPLTCKRHDCRRCYPHLYASEEIAA